MRQTFPLDRLAFARKLDEGATVDELGPHSHRLRR